jgi:lysophospholipid acyltransferase (LPLAT)-like uncharacterized protein
MSMRRGAANAVRDPSMRGAIETTRESRMRIGIAVVAIAMSHVRRGVIDVGSPMRIGIVAVVIAMSHVKRGAIDVGRRISMRRGAEDVVRGPSRRGAIEITRESPKRNEIAAVVNVMSHVTRDVIDVGKRMSTRRGAIAVVKDPSMKVVAVAIAMSRETES